MLDCQNRFPQQHNQLKESQPQAQSPIGEEIFRSFVEESQDPFFIIKHNRFMYANAALCEAADYSQEELNQLFVWELFTSADQPIVRKISWNLLNTEAYPYYFQAELLDKQGHKLSYEFWARLGQMQNDRVIYFTGKEIHQARQIADKEDLELRITLGNQVMHILTEYQQPEYALRDYRALISDSFPEYTFEIAHLRDNVLIVFQHIDGEWIGTEYDLKRSSCCHLKDDPRVQSRSLIHSATFPEDLAIINSGARYVLEIPIFGLRGVRGTLRAAFKKDATPKKRALLIDLIQETGISLESLYYREKMNRFEQERLEEDRNALALKFNALEEMSTSMTHEIRNLMLTVSGYLQMLKMDHGIDPKDYDIMMEEIGHANRLLCEFLKLAKTSSRQVDLMDMNTLIDRCLDIIHGQVVYEQMHIFKELDTSTPMEVLIDQDKMKQAIINISQNAIEAMKPGGMLCIRSGVKQGRACVKFIDNGEGIPAQALKVILKPYFTTKVSGTGIGLPVSDRIIRDHGGDLLIESEVGKGTCVTISLPLFEGEDHVPEADPE